MFIQFLSSMRFLKLHLIPFFSVLSILRVRLSGVKLLFVIVTWWALQSGHSICSLYLKKCVHDICLHISSGKEICKTRVYAYVFFYICVRVIDIWDNNI